MEYECEYKSKIEQLQSENRQKEERIRQLEAQLDHLQVGYSIWLNVLAVLPYIITMACAWKLP